MTELLTIADDVETTALVFAGRRVSYTEFRTWVRAYADRLRDRGVGPEVAVVVAVERSVELVVAAHAVVAAGGCYVPMDPSAPENRIHDTVSATGARVALVGPGSGDVRETLGDLVGLVEIDCSGALPRSNEALEPPRCETLHADNPAYTLFTSGSTGVPKGVTVSHRSVVNRFESARDELTLKETDVFVQKTPITFDPSVTELFMPFVVGGTLVVAEPGRHADARYLADLLIREAVTVVHFVPSVLAAFVEEVGMRLADSHALRVVMSGGEALTPAVAKAAQETFVGASIVNLYGPAETTLEVATSVVRVDEGSHIVPIGPPARGVRTYVLDSWLQWVPEGVPGELYIGGVQVARGYAGQSDLTAARFVADPFGPVGSRLYRTGDRVRWNARGELEYLGRNDFQVKLRGQRLELGEIEAVLTSCPGVVNAAAAVRNAGAGEQLVGYVTPASVDMRLVDDELARSLPEYMRPTAWVLLDEMPLNNSGKVARRLLPEPQIAAVDHVAPTGPAEERLAAIFDEVLGTDGVSADASLFDVGGNSLSAMRIAARATDAFDVDVTIRDVFEAGTVRTLASTIGRGGTLPAVVRAESRPDEIPLSHAQTRMWFINRFDPTSGSYNIPLVMRLTGVLDVDALWGAVADVVARHEVLRTTFPASAGVPFQRVHDVSRIPSMLDVAAATTGDDIEWAATAGFDLSTVWPIRARLLDTGDGGYVFALVLHHIASDGESLRPLVGDLVTAYAQRVAGDPAGLPDLDVQVADHAIWQHDVLGDPADPESIIGRQLAFWRNQLTGLPDVLELPTDTVRPAIATGRGARTDFVIPADVARRVEEVARSHRMTPFMVLHAALAVLLARLSATDDLAIGTPIAGRDRRELEPLIGMFVNTLVLRTAVVPEQSFTDLLDRVRQTDLDAFAHGDVPFETVVDAVGPVRSEAFAPLAQVWLTVDGATSVELAGTDLDSTTVGELTISPMPTESVSAKVDLLVGVSPAPEGDWGGSVIYATDLFRPATVERFARQLVRILDEVTATPTVGVGGVALADAVEPATVTGGSATPAVLLPDIFAEAARRWPSHVAVVDSHDSQLTYAEIDRESNRLARWLIARGAGPETLVALALNRSTELLTAIWAVAKTGAGYVPIDPGYPAERVSAMIADSGAHFGLAHVDGLPSSTEFIWIATDSEEVQAGIGSFGDGPLSDADRAAPIRVDNVAYVIYTSGSTGRPKGVAVTHSGLANFGTEEIRRADADPAARVLGFASPSFDASVLEYLLATMSGGTLVYRPQSAVGGIELQDYMIRHGITHTFLTPSVLSTLIPSALPTLHTVYAGGEAVPQLLVDRWAPVHRVQNLYGPTETTIGVTIGQPMDAGEPVLLGGPLAGVGLVVADSRLQPVPEGVVGELYVSGGALSRGYLDRPGLTAERFVANPFGRPGERMYRTGDLVRWRRVGDELAVDYLGRSDTQVKLRGLRLELGEIESVIGSFPGVRSVVVVGVGGIVTTALAAYVVSDPGLDTDSLKAFTGQRLPGFMVPDTVTVLDELPLTPVGKLDRRALPEPDAIVGDYVAPEGQTELAVAEIMAEILEAPHVSATTSFFELGGNSLSATRLVARLRETCGFDIELVSLFRDPTVRGIARAVEAGDRSVGSVLLPLRTQGTRPPLFCIHPAGGLAWFYGGLAPYLTDRPIYGVQDPYVVTGEAINSDAKEIARRYVDEIRRVRATGPYHLLGWSVGGVLADAVATTLQDEGEHVAFLGVMDARPLESDEHSTETGHAAEPDGELVADILGGWRDLFDLGADVTAATPDQVAEIVRAQLSGMGLIEDDQVGRIMESFAAAEVVVARFRPSTFVGDMLVFTATADKDDPAIVAEAWRPYVTGQIRNVDIDTHHLGLADEAALAVIGPELETALRWADGSE
ncbi:non-ribosomal peptide synthetase [Gordonia otitidis]|uniref:Non-ribosomal peptide synthetase n=1 Tax=Gordonia otitidis (strain DSM 44809 / CCUG 52243 / JCM 12355 / NBRC 100426 / IFM 10032) TaxID=1108044 RepID=H5TJM0_GORO1|nr:non-ribosomal peptide synthetase [Gordonia otitidis]GAB33678.1 putative non-ribosomal peptide synthetase [Gordonia otitidis NBRC 100426]